KRRLPGPSASTTPTTWWPGTRGSRGSGRSPSITWRSVRQMAHAATRTSSSPGPGTGAGSRTGSRGRDWIGAWRPTRILFTSPSPREGAGRAAPPLAALASGDHDHPAPVAQERGEQPAHDADQQRAEDGRPEAVDVEALHEGRGEPEAEAVQDEDEE